MSGFSTDGKTELDIFTELDPLGTGRTRPFVDRKDFFNDLKNPPRKGMSETDQSSASTPPIMSANKIETSIQPESLGAAEEVSTQSFDAAAIPNSFSTNFNPPPGSTSSGHNSSGIDFDTHFKTAAFSFNARSESPPNYSPPPPPRSNMSSDTGPRSSKGVPILPPPSTNSPSASMRLMSKKSPQILKQLTIAESSSGTKTLPSRSSGRFTKQYTLDSSLKDEIPNLSPPPRPPHSSSNTTPSPGTIGGRAAAKLSAAVPRPSSGSSGDRLRLMPAGGAVSGLPPEPPPRPLQSTSMMSSPNTGHFSQPLTSPPPLPPKKQNLNTALSNPLGTYKPPLDSRSMASNASSRNSHSEANDLPLPMPLRKTHTNALSDHHSNTFVDSFQTSGGRYSVPLNNSQPNSLTLSGSPSLGKRDNISTKSNSSMDSLNSNQGVVQKLSMEQALAQVASLSLGDLAKRLELPVDKLSSLTIQQLAEKLTDMDIKSKKSHQQRSSVQVQRGEKDHQLSVVYRSKQASTSSSRSDHSESKFAGFDDDFSTASAPPGPSTHSHSHSGKDGQRNTNYDRYAVFRNLDLEDASGFSIFGASNSLSDKANNSSMMCNIGNNSEDDEDDFSRTQEKTLTSRDSSSERTLQADDITFGAESNHNRNVSIASAIALANTMDDVTDVNLSDDQDDNGKFPEDEEDLASGFMNKPEWATFDSNFDDQFCTTALVKAEGGNESPSWESDNENGAQESPPGATPRDQQGKDGFDFQPFEKPTNPAPLSNDELIRSPPAEERSIAFEKDMREPRYPKTDNSSPDRIRSPPEGHFRRQSSGSSRHSERSSGGGPNNGSSKPGKSSEFSDSGRPTNSRSKARKGSRDYDRWDERGGDFDRDREGSGRHGRDRVDREYGGRPDSRTSYSSVPRKYHRERDSDEEYNGNNSIRRSSGGGGNGKVRLGSGRRDREYERERGEVEIEDEDDDRSHASYHSNYSSGGHPRRHRRYPPKHYHHHTPSRGGRKVGSGASPERYSNHESDDESVGDENGSYSRRDKRDRDRDYYAREKEYYDRYHRHRPSSSSGGFGGKRPSRDSPRHTDSYYRRDPRRAGRHRKDEDFDDSRDFSDYSGEEEYYGHSNHHGHGSHRRIRSKRSHPKERDPREHRGHYYTNSPSWDSESGPEGATGERDRGDNKTSSRPNSSKYREDRSSRRGGSPELPNKYDNSIRRDSGSRRYQSELALNSKGANGGGNEGSQKLTAFNFTDDFGPNSSRLSPETTNTTQPHSLQTSDQLSSLSPTHERNSKSRNHQNEKMTTSTGVHDLVNCVSELPVENKASIQSNSPFEDDFVAQVDVASSGNTGDLIDQSSVWDENNDKSTSGGAVQVGFVMENGQIIEEASTDGKKGNVTSVQFPNAFDDDDGESPPASQSSPNGTGDDLGNSNADVFPPANDPKVFPFTGRRLESIKSEEEKSNDDSHSHSASESAVQMKKSDSFNIFKQRAEDPFADDDFFA
jgi:hypothetical protein